MNSISTNGQTAKPKFSMGQLLATPGALEVLQQSNQLPSDFLAKHMAGDWGETCLEDNGLNDEALIDGSRIMSVYRTSKGVKIWIITEAADDQGNREATTFLLPEEY